MEILWTDIEGGTCFRKNHFDTHEIQKRKNITKQFPCPGMKILKEYTFCGN